MSSTAPCVRSAMLKIMTEKVELFNSNIVFIFTSHDKFHVGKGKTQDKRELYTAQGAEGSNRASLKAFECRGTVAINTL